MLKTCMHGKSLMLSHDPFSTPCRLRFINEGGEGLFPEYFPLYDRYVSGSVHAIRLVLKKGHEQKGCTMMRKTAEWQAHR